VFLFSVPNTEHDDPARANGWPTQALLWLEWGAWAQADVVRSSACASARKTDSGAVFASTPRAVRDAWRLNASGRQETGTGSWQALSSNQTAPLKPKQGLSGPPAAGPKAEGLSIRQFENSTIAFLFSVPNTEHDDPAAHPCKKRRDGAPSALLARAGAGPPARLCPAIERPHSSQNRA
jgi:hypothetical protein